MSQLLFPTICNSLYGYDISVVMMRQRFVIGMVLVFIVFVGIGAVLVWYWCGISLVINLERTKCERKSFETFFIEAAQETSSSIGRRHFRTSGGKIPKYAQDYRF